MKRPEPIELENNLGPDAVTGEINRVPWMAYDVDEMDIYIAEKDAEIAELKEQVHDYAQGLYVMQARAEKEAQHHKYKRCLAMAAWCFEKSYSTTLVKYDKESGLLRNFYDWWGKYWLKLAEKFKPNKSTAK